MSLTMDMLNMLSAPITRDDIHVALFDRNPLKALGPDGLHATFFQHHWDVIGDSICEIVMKVF